jgi:hypothetical protein
MTRLTRNGRQGDEPGVNKYKKQLYATGVRNAPKRAYRHGIRFQELRNLINYEIVKNLKITRKSSLIKMFKIVIPSSFSNFLKDKYNISNKFLHVDSFENDFNLHQKRYYSENDYVVIEENSFMLKILKTKSIKNFYADNKLRPHHVEGPIYLSIKLKIKNVITPSNEILVSGLSGLNLQ